VREVGDQVISLAAVKGRGRASGVALQFRPGAIFTFGHGGRITRLRLDADRGEALKAVGPEK
jgi:hypothetical protein